MAKKLTEEEVHQACADIAAQGERPTSLNLLDKIGRGSLTTITKYLNSWNISDDAQAIDAESLPAIVQLPAELSKEGEDLLKKMWAVAKNITDNELDVQREALKQAEIFNQQKVEETFKFSEAQAMKIERLEEAFLCQKEELKIETGSKQQLSNELIDVEKVNVGLIKDNEQIQKEVQQLKNKILNLEESSKKAKEEKHSLLKNYDKERNGKESIIKTLEIDLSKLNEKLSSVMEIKNTLSVELKIRINEDNLKESKIKSLEIELSRVNEKVKLVTETKDNLINKVANKSKELSKSVLEREKLNTHYETAYKNLELNKDKLKLAYQASKAAEKLVAKLEGKLEVYKSLGK
jgi:hypothetical protein